jgi:formamidopyrimidine-DNA glycosylase
MPELPEVETIRRHLAPHVEGRRLTSLEVLDPRWSLPLAPTELAAAVEGRVIERLARRGKYLVWELEDEAFLLMHLRMTGTLLLDPAGAPPHTRVWLRLEDPADVDAATRSASSPPAEAPAVASRRIAFVDPRRFGTGELALGPAALEAFFAARLGEEPLEAAFTGAHLYAQARSSRAPIKALLLDQRRVAGVGNIYADEALFRAGIHPLRPSNRLTLGQCGALRDAVVAALRAGIAAKGATIDDFRDPDGARGSFQDQFLVHRREGEPCPTCGGTIRKLRAAGRGTYVCERCQPRPRKPRYAASARPSRPPARSA